MAKFERNPSGSFPEKTKNKLPDFPLLILMRWYGYVLGMKFSNCKFILTSGAKSLRNRSVDKCKKSFESACV